jgi:hypothetical protein
LLFIRQRFPPVIFQNDLADKKAMVHTKNTQKCPK